MLNKTPNELDLLLTLNHRKMNILKNDPYPTLTKGNYLTAGLESLVRQKVIRSGWLHS